MKITCKKGQNEQGSCYEDMALGKIICGNMTNKINFKEQYSYKRKILINPQVIKTLVDFNENASDK